jgi:MATE family multidrug resistance protein
LVIPVTPLAGKAVSLSLHYAALERTRSGYAGQIMTSFSKAFHLRALYSLLAIAIPMIVSQGAFAVMIFTDRYFLAQVSPAHMAAGMGGGVAWYFSFCLFSGILAYANALVAQYLGAGETHKCSRVITQGLVLSVLCIPVLVVITLLMQHIFAGMGHAPAQVKLEQEYYVILMISSFMALVKTCLASFFSGIGRTRVVMVCEVLGIIVNIPLSYALVFGHFGLPALDIRGAAWGTVISSGFTTLVFAGFYLQKENRARFHLAGSLVFDRGITRRYLRLGFPSGLEMFLNVAAFNLFLLMFHSYGVVEAASATITFNWDILSFVPLLGLNIAVMSLIGRAIGAGDLQKTDEITASGYVLGLGYSLMLATLFVIFRKSLVEMFIFGDQEAAGIRELANFMMIGLSCYVLLEGVLQVAAGVLRGAGDTHWIMVTSVSLHWSMLVAQFFIIKVFGFGPRISWVAFVLMILAIVAFFLWRLHSQVWRDPERLRAVMAE